jgi:hypothetical protein
VAIEEVAKTIADMEQGATERRAESKETPP